MAGLAPLLKISDVTVRFGGVTAVDDVSVEIRAGEFVGLLGPNGAGKTTLLRVISGMIVPNEGRIAMADCSILSDAEQALSEGADVVGSTLAGYTGPVEPTEPDLDLVAAMRRLTPHVVAEGNIRTPAQAQQALIAGASMVVVGSAITRPEYVTSWFRSALDTAIAGSGA